MNTEEKILELLEKMNVRMEALESGQAKMQDDITGIKARLDYDVDVRLKAINEDVDIMSKKLDTLDEVKELAEKTAAKVDAIHAVVSQHSASITELKKAR